MAVAKTIKRYFFRGLAVLLPTILTISIFVWGYRFIQDNISIHINRWLVKLTLLIMRLDPANEEAVKSLKEFWISGAGSVAGFILALIAVCIVGAVLASVVGKSLWHVIENFILRAPFLKQVYPYVKNVTDFLFTQGEEKKELISRVVAVEYPRKGVWVMGFVTGNGLKRVVGHSRKEFVTVLIPTSPTPFTGFTIMVAKDETIELEMSLEEAFRFIVSGGVITPPGEAGYSLPEEPEPPTDSEDEIESKS
jgi:uncharacterized membrane protein